MNTSFLAETFQTTTPLVSTNDSTEITADRESVKVVIYGSKRGVNNTILTLYKLGFAQVNEWSPLLPSSNPGEVMSILTRHILAN
ncbi:hypothetical protein VF14_28195 [Nostoc linckia z18]|uniref:Peptide ABC transporter substrate-binding protein n=2 Tax=Nostoc linckia TaxID=92942 RepID=A0A9Q5Z7F8_NOSLI|nr:hypothetical protein [Nostoc linckia]PHK27078.1 hypothetical protein VF12_35920 [Nostoc linckia z15]PHK43967.1 hypothetical protein VF13_24295 [Nostoc linckia z16]PHJ56140.1 hypothetical protein VF02_34065 [Nostoc linckia z1]PHJ63403.1 hypothetical protein VF05_24800 [Nostoc linckia z3]PHJ66183.1 hypothetical protein VF03_26880 [Nostoc linckia z2]